MRTILAFAIALAVALYLALNVYGILVLVTLYRTEPRAAVLLHEWPMNALVLVSAAPLGALWAATLRPTLRYTFWALIPVAAAGMAAGQNLLLAPSPLTISVIQFDLLAAIVTLAVTFLATAAVALATR